MRQRTRERPQLSRGAPVASSGCGRRASRPAGPRQRLRRAPRKPGAAGGGKGRAGRSSRSPGGSAGPAAGRACPSPAGPGAGRCPGVRGMAACCPAAPAPSRLSSVGLERSGVLCRGRCRSGTGPFRRYVREGAVAGRVVSFVPGSGTIDTSVLIGGFVC